MLSNDRWARVGLIILDAFVAVTAIGGGLALVAGLEASRFPIDWLTGTPFDGYVLPGLILAAIVGGSAAIATVATILRDPGDAPLSIAAAVILVGWIVGEILLLTADHEVVSPTEAVYLAVGLAILGLGVTALRRRTTPRVREP